jgi:signal recognition particle receptor subunit beta
VTITPIEFKVVIAGPFGVGKTTLIENTSNVPVIGTEVETTGDEALEKDSTTVGLEYGRFSVDTDAFAIALLLYGTPGQERFRFMWESVSIGADGFIVLVDATRPETWSEAKEALSYFGTEAGRVCVVGANRCEEDSPEQKALQAGLDTSVPIVACDVTDAVSARSLMASLLSELIDAAENESDAQLVTQP